MAQVKHAHYAPSFQTSTPTIGRPQMPSPSTPARIPNPLAPFPTRALSSGAGAAASRFSISNLTPSIPRRPRAGRLCSVRASLRERAPDCRRVDATTVRLKRWGRGQGWAWGANRGGWDGGGDTDEEREIGTEGYGRIWNDAVAVAVAVLGLGLHWTGLDWGVVMGREGFSLGFWVLFGGEGGAMCGALGALAGACVVFAKPTTMMGLDGWIGLVRLQERNVTSRVQAKFKVSCRGTEMRGRVCSLVCNQCRRSRPPSPAQSNPLPLLLAQPSLHTPHCPFLLSLPLPPTPPPPRVHAQRSALPASKHLHPSHPKLSTSAEPYFLTPGPSDGAPLSPPPDAAFRHGKPRTADPTAGMMRVGLSWVG